MRRARTTSVFPGAVVRLFFSRSVRYTRRRTWQRNALQ